MCGLNCSLYSDIFSYFLHRKTVITFDIICTLNVTKKLKCKKLKNLKLKKMSLVIKSDNTNWEILEVQIN